MAASIATSRATDLSFIAPSSEPASGDSSNDQINAAAIVEHLRKHGSQYFPSLKPRFSISIERIRGSTNPVFRFVLSDGKKSFGVFAKRPAVYPENNEALSEYQNYTDFNLSRSEPCGFQCPQVLTLMSGSEVLLTEEAEGSSLLKLIRGPSAVRHPRSMDCLTAVELSAKWLAAFHQLAASTEEPGEVTDHIPLLNGARELDDWLAGILGRELAQSLNHWRHSVIGIWRNSAGPIGRWHGDFGAGNVVVGVDKVTVLDAAFRSPGPQLADLAEFLTYHWCFPVPVSSPQRGTVKLPPHFWRVTSGKLNWLTSNAPCCKIFHYALYGDRWNAIVEPYEPCPSQSGHLHSAT